MLKYIRYGRKSMKEETRQVLSIEAQRAEVERIASEHELQIVGAYEESMTAKEPGRPGFNEMIRRIESGEADAIVTWKLDRLARNFADGGKIITLLQLGVLKEIKTFERTYLPTDNVLLIAVEFGMATQHSRDIANGVQRTYREKLRRGVFPGKAPLGYENVRRTRTIEPHPVHFEKMKKILNLFATSQYTLSTIQRKMTEAKLFGDREQEPLTLGSVRKLLMNPFFYGVFLFKGELHQGSHVPMVSKDTWDKIQSALVNRGKPRRNRIEKGLPFANFAVCGCCGYSVTGERHTKKSGLCFRYYRCTHKGKAARCENRGYVRHDDFVAEVKRNAALLALSDEWKERFLARVETWEEEGSTTADAKLSSLQTDLEKLKARIERLNAAFADGDLELIEFREMKNPLLPKKAELEQKIAALTKARTNRLEPLRNWILEANTVEKTISGQDWPELKKFLQKVGSNRILRGQSLDVSFIKPWNSIALTTIAVRSTADPAAESLLMCRGGDSNP